MCQCPPRPGRQATPQAARTTTPEPPAPLLALRPRRHATVWALLICMYPLLAAGYLWRTDLHRTNSAHLLISAAVFVIRTLWFHLGLLLAAIAVVVLGVGVLWSGTALTPEDGEAPIGSPGPRPDAAGPTLLFGAGEALSPEAPVALAERSAQPAEVVSPLPR